MSSASGGQRSSGGPAGGESGGSKSNGGASSGSSRGRGKSSRSGRNRSSTKPPNSNEKPASTEGSASIGLPTSAAPKTVFKRTSGAKAATADDGLVPGSGLLALQALAAASRKGTAPVPEGAFTTPAVAQAAERAIARTADPPSSTKGDRGRGGGAASRSSRRGSGGSSGGGGSSRRSSTSSTPAPVSSTTAEGGAQIAAGKPGSNQNGGDNREKTGSRGKGGVSTGGRGGFAAAAAAAAAVGSRASAAATSRPRSGSKGVEDAGSGRGLSRRGGGGKHEATAGKNAGGGDRAISEADEMKKAEEKKKQLAAQQEQRKKAEEERRKKAEEDRRAVEEKRARREAEEKERSRKAEAEKRRRELEEKRKVELKRKAEEQKKRLEERKAKVEAEAKRIAEEKARQEEEDRKVAERLQREEARALEEEKRRQEAEQERVRREFEAQLEAVSQLDLLQKEERARWELRAKHTPEALKASREAHEANKSKLKSDLKKTTAFTKKVRALNEDQRRSLTKDVEGLNLTRYVSEIVDAVAENKLKSADVSVAVHLCCLMHQRYPEFAEDLISRLAAPFAPTAGGGAAGGGGGTLGMAPGAAAGLEEEKEEKEVLRRKRSNLRLLVELHMVGLFDASRMLIRIVRSLCGEEAKDSKRQRPAPVFGDGKRREQQTVTASPPHLRDNDVILLAGFVRSAGEDLVGVLQRKNVQMLKLAGEMGTLERKPVVEPDVKARFRSFVDGAFDSLCTHLENGHEQLGRLERKMERDRLTNGTLTEEKERNLEESRKAYEALLANVNSLAASLNRDMPELPDHEEEEEAGGISLWEGGVGGDGAGYNGPFEESERSFYEDLPDLLNTVPPNLLGLTEEQAEQLREDERQKQRDRAAGVSSAAEEEQDGIAEDGGEVDGGDADRIVEELKGLSVGDGEDEDEGAEGESDEEDEEEKDGSNEGEGEGGEYISRNARLMLMLEDELPNCHNQERVDAFAKKFCYLNSKSARKKLVQALFDVPRQALDLLPMYSRLVAILDKAMKSIAPALLEELRAHFRYFLRKKAPGQIDHRIKNVRFIGELVKFRVAPPVVAFQCLRSCLNDFSSLAIQTMAALLETCGRFLFRQKLTHQRMRNFLTVMMKLKKAKNLDPRPEALIDNAFYTCCPPERQQRAAKVRTPLQLYIRHLMLERLRDDPEVVESVIKQLRKLPWQDPEVAVESEVLRASLRLCRSSYPSIHLAADVLSGLARYQDRVAVKAVDAILEAIQRGIELEDGTGRRESQRLMGYARLLAEMYNYAVVGSPTVFETLHRLLDEGHEVPLEMKQPRADPRNPSAGLQPPAASLCARFDPRVYTPTDPPGDTLRIRLVVSILEGCGSYFVRGQGLVKLSKFMASFQRYLFCKERLPASTEFAVLDLIDDLEAGAKAAREKERAKAQKVLDESKGSKSRGSHRGGKGELEEAKDDGSLLPKHRSWEEAQAAVDEADRAWDEENKRKLGKIAELQRREKEASGSGCEGATDEEGEEEEEEEEDDDDDERGSRGSASEGEDGADGDGRGGDQDATDAREDPEVDENGVEGGDDVVVRGGDTVERSEEDGEAEDEFEALLSKTMAESVEKSKIARATTQVMGHMAVPMVHKNTNIKAPTHNAPLTGGSGIAFKLLKRGNKGKMEAQEVVVPASTSLAAQVSRNEEASKEEISIIKARVLAYEANIEAAVLAQESDGGGVPLPEDYTQFIPKVHNAPLHPESGRGGGRGGGSGSGRGGGGGGTGRGAGRGAPQSGRGAGGRLTGGGGRHKR